MAPIMPSRRLPSRSRCGYPPAHWVIHAYALTFGGLLLLGGKAADRYGRGRLLLFGLGLFGLASLVGGLAQEPGHLVAARAAQGVGAAALAPTALALLTAAFPSGRARVRAFGVWSAMNAAGRLRRPGRRPAHRVRELALGDVRERADGRVRAGSGPARHRRGPADRSRRPSGRTRCRPGHGGHDLAGVRRRPHRPVCVDLAGHPDDAGGRRRDPCRVPLRRADHRPRAADPAQPVGQPLGGRRERLQPPGRCGHGLVLLLRVALPPTSPRGRAGADRAHVPAVLPRGDRRFRARRQARLPSRSPHPCGHRRTPDRDRARLVRSDQPRRRLPPMSSVPRSSPASASGSASHPSPPSPPPESRPTRPAPPPACSTAHARSAPHSDSPPSAPRPTTAPARPPHPRPSTTDTRSA
jgi:hypothetical protein